MKRFSPRFATVGFSKDVEKKYRDRAMTIDGFQTLTTALTVQHQQQEREV